MKHSANLNSIPYPMKIKHLFPFFFICSCITTLVGCNINPKVQHLSSDEFESLIQEEDVQCVDVRTVAEYSDGHIPGSINLNILDKNFSSEAQELLNKEAPVAVYCKSGRRSRKAANILTELGFNVYNLDKGIEDWKKNKKNIEK